MMKEGPTLVTKSVWVCGLCWHMAKMCAPADSHAGACAAIRFYCRHPDAVGRTIGTSSLMPDWCPAKDLAARGCA